MKLLVLSAALLAMPLANAEDPVIEETPVVVEEETPIEEETTPVEEEKFDLGKWFREFFTADRIAMITTWAGYLATIITLAVKLSQIFKKKNSTIDEVIGVIKEVLNEKLDEELKKEIMPLFENISAELKDYKVKDQKAKETMARILALSQSNDANSRVAILKEIANLGFVEESEIEKAEQIIIDQENAKKVAENEAIAELDEIIEDTENDISGLAV